jgi:hypothetical protein
MDGNLTFEIPEADASRFESLLDEWLQLLTRMEAERPQREQEDARHNREFRETMDVIWARLEDVERGH